MLPKVRETCACGAVFEMADDWSPNLTRGVRDFRKAHEMCREPVATPSVCAHCAGTPSMHEPGCPMRLT